MFNPATTGGAQTDAPLSVTSVTMVPNPRSGALDRVRACWDRLLERDL